MCLLVRARFTIFVKWRFFVFLVFLEYSLNHGKGIVTTILLTFEKPSFLRHVSLLRVKWHHWLKVCSQTSSSHRKHMSSELVMVSYPCSSFLVPLPVSFFTLLFSSPFFSFFHTDPSPSSFSSCSWSQVWNLYFWTRTRLVNGETIHSREDIYI